MRKLMTVCVALLIFSGIHAGDKKMRARGVSQWAEAAPAVKEVAKAEPQTFEQRPKLLAKTETAKVDTANASTDALDEVNAERAKRGLPAFQRDPLLSQAAYKAASLRASRGLHGHLESDFACLPEGAVATAAGCGALEDSWGWGTCCTYDNYTHAGAAWVRGSDGRRYMHLFVRNEGTSAPKASASPVTYESGGSCANGSCGTQSFSRRGRR